MTISTTTIKNSYSGNSSTDTFAYTFKISDEDHIQVIIRSSTGTETVKVKTTHYSVSGVGNASGGTVTMGSAPASGVTKVGFQRFTEGSYLGLLIIVKYDLKSHFSVCSKAPSQCHR